MTTRNVKILAVLAITLAAAPIAFANHARADDSEDMNAPRQNWPQNVSFRNQGNRNNCGNGNDCGLYNARRNNDEQEGKQSRFSRKNRDGRGGDGGDDD